MKNENLFVGKIGKKKFYFRNEKVKFIYEMLGFCVCLASMYFYAVVFYAMIKG